MIDKDFVSKILQKDVLVIVDEAYYEFSGKTCIDLIDDYSNLVILRTFSKWAGLAGMRIGYGIMNPSLVSHLLIIKPPYNISVAAEIAVKASLDDLELLDHFYSEYGFCPNVHLKFDTGMTRLGFDCNDTDKVFSFLADHDYLPFIGIYSHFATADEGDLSYAESHKSTDLHEP